MHLAAATGGLHQGTAEGQAVPGTLNLLQYVHGVKGYPLVVPQALAHVLHVVGVVAVDRCVGDVVPVKLLHQALKFVDLAVQSLGLVQLSFVFQLVPIVQRVLRCLEHFCSRADQLVELLPAGVDTGHKYSS